MTTIAYTDGACLGNPGPGGWAWAVPGGAFASGAAAATTNQRMEVQAAYEAMLTIAGPLHIVSDSTYVVKCFNDRWYEGWERRGWKNASKQPVANQDLWRPMIERYLERIDEITFAWVKGHSGDVMNDVVDRLAVEAARTQQGRRGDEPPTELGDADEPSESGANSAATIAATDALTRTLADARVTAASASGIAGWKVAVFGHKPPQLGGYEPDNPTATDVRRRIGEVLRAWRSIHPDLVVLTGLGLGAEQLAADVCIAEGLPYVAVLAHPDPEKMWPDSSKRRYRALLGGARSTVTLTSATPATKQAAGKAAGDRDSWLVGTADAALVVWDGADRGLGDLVAALERKDVDTFPITPGV